MIEAVAKAAMGEGRPPVELDLAWMCGDGLLPEVGGVMDQDYVTMERMRAARNIYNAVVRLRDAGGANIHQLNNRERRIIRSLRDTGVL